MQRIGAKGRSTPTFYERTVAVFFSGCLENFGQNINQSNNRSMFIPSTTSCRVSWSPLVWTWLFWERQSPSRRSTRRIVRARLFEKCLIANWFVKYEAILTLCFCSFQSLAFAVLAWISMLLHPVCAWYAQKLSGLNLDTPSTRTATMRHACIAKLGCTGNEMNRQIPLHHGNYFFLTLKTFTTRPLHIQAITMKFTTFVKFWLII